MRGEGTRAVHELAVAQMIAAVEKAHPGELILGPAHQVMAPQGRQRAMIARGIDGIEVEPLLPARQSTPRFLAPDLPAAGVAAEEGDVAPAADVLLQVVTH